MANDSHKNDQFTKESQRKRSKKSEMESQMNEKEKLKLLRKKNKFSEVMTLASMTDEEMEIRSTEQSQDPPQPKIVRESSGEAQECAKSERKKKVKLNLQSNIEIKHGRDENHDAQTTSRENEQNDASASTNWVQKASWKSLVGQTGRISFSLSSVLGQNLSSQSITNSVGVIVDDDDTKDGLLVNNTKLSNNVNSWVNGCSSTLPLSNQSRKPVINATDKICAQIDSSESLKHQPNKFVRAMQTQAEKENPPQTTRIQKEIEQQTHSSLLLMVTSAKV